VHLFGPSILTVIKLKHFYNIEKFFCLSQQIFAFQRIGAIYKGQAAQEDSKEDWNVSAFLDCLTLEDGIDRLSRNVGAKLLFDVV
jgi:hypothetical protein